MNYYNEIKDVLVKNEVYKKVKDYSKNKSDLNAYFEVGRLIVEAQGGEARAKYGNKLIKEYSEKLTKELGRGYGVSNLKDMRQVYLKFRKCRTLFGELSWNHYVVLSRINDNNKINYFINLSKNLNLSIRELKARIKSKEYERIGKNVDTREPKVNSLIKNPILIKVKNKNEKLTEYALHQSILENMDDFLKELGMGFAYIGNEVKIKIGDNYHYIDFLLFNYIYNSFVIIELKVTVMRAEYIGQVMKYIGYVNKYIRKPFHDETVGVIICRKENKYVMEFCTNPNIFATTYQTI